jgi:hypothetical protein
MKQMKSLKISMYVCLALSFGCTGTQDILGKIPGAQKDSAKGGLTNETVIRGLKEALTIGTEKATQLAGRPNGFYQNPRIYIPWPAEAQEMKDRLIKMGFSDKVDQFEKSLNQAAEDAATSAVPIFTAAIADMSIADGFAILKGNDTSATHYLRRSTYTQLHDKFLPYVKASIEKVSVTRYWSPLVSAYNVVPGVRKQNPDLDEYVTDKAIGGLMLLIADEERRIRKDPVARVTDLLRKVFGSQ